MEVGQTMYAIISEDSEAMAALNNPIVDQQFMDVEPDNDLIFTTVVDTVMKSIKLVSEGADYSGNLYLMKGIISTNGMCRMATIVGEWPPGHGITTLLDMLKTLVRY